MKSLKPMLLICTLLFFAPVIMASGPGSTTGTVAETMDSGGYTYVRLKEQGQWIATSPMTVSVGDRIKYKGGMEMRNFHSRTLDRTFETILFAQNVSRVSQDVESMHREAMAVEGHGTEKIAIPKTISVEVPAPGEIAPLADGKTIADIVAEPAQLEDQQVSLRARVMKVSQNIMGKNWITLQDGTGAAPGNKLMATSAELVSPGDLVIASGILKNDVDLGSGYKYKILLEQTTFGKGDTTH